MNHRRIVGVVLLMALLGTALPAVCEAGVFGQPTIGAEEVEPGVFARLFDWLRALFTQFSQPFVAQEGASPTGSG